MLDSDKDTICAISTPAGVGGIAVARVSGRNAVEIADRVWRGRASLQQARTHTAHFGTVFDPDGGEDLDQGVATVYRGPRSFTGEDVVELAVHGSRYVQRELINLLIRQGARLAEPGEFTRRAFTSGRIDLAEAEGIADMIAATSRAAGRVAMSQMKGCYSAALRNIHDNMLQLASLLELELDFSEEDVEFADRSRLNSIASESLATVERLASTFAAGQALKDGIPVAIVGPANAGKSTLLNLLVGDQRAIVSNIPGTTRDTIEDTAEISGTLFRFTDTAGLRATTDTIERIGIDRAVQAAAQASIVVWVVDCTDTTTAVAEAYDKVASGLSPTCRHILVANKTDLGNPADSQAVAQLKALLPPTATTIVSHSTDMPATTETLRRAIFDASGTADIRPDDIIVTNQRHYQALTLAAAALRRVLDGLLTADIPADLIAQDLREALHHLATITGAITSTDILHSIFTHFCIGK